METDRSKYGINVKSMPTQQLKEYLESKAQQLQQIETQLEIGWEELYWRGESDHK